MHRSLLALILVACGSGDPASAPPASTAPSGASADEAAPAGEPGPILVELYTSQGCSSCPPADRLLSLIGDGELGDDVIPMAFHVDYWNYIGWSDPFSDKRWSERQRRAARALSGRVYTPMLVINGRADVVGSNRSDVASRIRAARRAGNRVSLTVQRGAIENGQLAATVTATGADGAEVFVAVTESALATAVPRGENAGRDLANDHVVRALVPAPLGPNNRAQVSIPLDPSWQPKALKLIAFAREAGSTNVLGAARE